MKAKKAWLIKLGTIPPFVIMDHQLASLELWQDTFGEKRNKESKLKEIPPAENLIEMIMTFTHKFYANQSEERKFAFIFDLFCNCNSFIFGPYESIKDTNLENTKEICFVDDIVKKTLKEIQTKK